MAKCVIIKFHEPIKSLYHSSDSCPPKERGDGCYGDCYDCYHRDCERYERYLEKGWPPEESKDRK